MPAARRAAPERTPERGVRALRPLAPFRAAAAAGLALGAALLAPLGLALPTSATTFVRVSDEALVAGSPLIVVATVAGRDEAAGRAGVATEYALRVERVLKGRAPEPLLRLHLPGGRDAHGRRLRLPGVPVFREGERALFFLEPGRGGSYRLRHLLLGAFREVAARGGRLALRDLAGATEARRSAAGGLLLAGGAEAERLEPPRDFAAFARWIARRAAGRESAPDYLRPGALPPSSSPAGKFLVLRGDDGLAVRWFEFDSGGQVAWRTHSSGQPGLTAGGALDAATAAACWNGDAATPIRYLVSGTTAAAGGFVADDGLNTVLWNDPNGEIGPFGCAEGGILAIGGPWFSASSLPFHGALYHPITSADVVLNDGIGCFFAGFERPGGGNLAAEALLGHELGHTLGLDHSAAAGSLMLASIPPARGCALAADDAAGAGRLYDPNAPAPLPPPPTGLTATPVSSSQIDLAWVDGSDNETGFHLEAKRPGEPFAPLVTLPRGSTSYRADGLAPSTSYTFRLRASSDEGFSPYSGEATATTPATGGGSPPCSPSETALCLDGRRFQVSVEWRLPGGESGAGRVVPGSTSDSGLFWFFAPGNWEMMVKVLDGCAVNGRHWVFVGAATDVEYTLRVVDGGNGEVRTYHQPGGVVGPVLTDTGAFAACP